jgi:hypothetical protein
MKYPAASTLAQRTSSRRPTPWARSSIRSIRPPTRARKAFTPPSGIILTYTHTFGTKYHLNALAGHEAQLNTYSYHLGAYRSNFPSNNVQAISSGDATTATNFGGQKVRAPPGVIFSAGSTLPMRTNTC